MTFMVTQNLVSIVNYQFRRGSSTLRLRDSLRQGARPVDQCGIQSRTRHLVGCTFRCTMLRPPTNFGVCEEVVHLEVHPTMMGSWCGDMMSINSKKQEVVDALWCRLCFSKALFQV